MTAYLANFDFDARLGGRGGGSQPRPGPPDENAVLWRIAAGEGDVILVPGLERAFDAPAVGPLAAVHFRPPDRRGEAAFVAWGLDELAQRLSGERVSDEQLALVRMLNDRKLAFDVDPLPGAVFTDDADHVLRRAAVGERLMLKPRHGGFGRGLRRILGVETDDNLVGWVRARCREGGLVVEPLVNVASEVGAHWDVDGAATLVGMTSSVCDEHGQFQRATYDRSSCDAADVAPPPQQIIESGYVGPLTIDRCRYLDADGSTQERLTQDVNARWSVGRLVLTAGRRIGAASYSVCRVHGDDERSPTGDSVAIPPLDQDLSSRWRVTVQSRG